MNPYAYRIRLADTDAAGRIYFAAAGRIAHEAFEQVMSEIGFALGTMIEKGDIGLPVVRAEADYHKPIKLGDLVTVRTRVHKIGQKSVTFQHEIQTAEGLTAIQVVMTHVAVSGKTGKPVSLPAKLKKILTLESAAH